MSWARFPHAPKPEQLKEEFLALAAVSGPQSPPWHRGGAPEGWQTTRGEPKFEVDEGIKQADILLGRG